MQNNNIISIATPGNARKKTAVPSQWKREKEKRRRHSSTGFPTRPKCEHNNSNQRQYQCKTLTMQDLRRAHQMFYDLPDKIKQDEIILRFVVISPIHRNRSRKDCFEKQVSIKYFMPKLNANGGRENVLVCKKAFTDIFRISKKRVDFVCKNYFKTGQSPKENRGGQRPAPKYEIQREMVKAFILKLKPIESHYCREKNTNRQYLPSEMSISSLYKVFNDTTPGQDVKYDFFRSIFCTDFNIGFGSPATDCCSLCISLTQKIKVTRCLIEKRELSTKLEVHKKKADAFYKLLQNENDGEITFSFDCQKNLVLPKVPDQSAYYSRQLYLYNFTVCQGTSKSKQLKENTFMYLWLETDYKKGSNEIASFVYHCLKNTNLMNIHTIRLFSDGCGGQNKNQVMLFMLSKFLQECPSHIKNVNYFYPIVGHSFIPPDRIFGRLEKQFKKIACMTSINDYLKIFETVGTVINVSSTNVCKVYDWKSSCLNILKPPANWHFKFAPTKRILLSKSKQNNVLVRGEPHYYLNVGQERGLCKRGKTLTSMKLNVLNKGVQNIKTAKKTDVDNLLKKHFGCDWRNLPDLEYYKTVINMDNEENNEQDYESDFGDINEENAEFD
ncbi:uncharacterized protein LOC126907768 [Daktulosphaira vitifoliae]|uniref:uncharacterized protein LOC126906002 n=1 Tax=Daktulosphaira vitifoliae TaxID=58002 RepID=UPI0021AA6BFA|nr:uncharacterized protein LOC126906002 [Daktulosphaira vitifoliae]XP_050545311.1 uncharacterized protein LOC126907768 [Daktulosphaira vitifoliae]